MTLSIWPIAHFCTNPCGHPKRSRGRSTTQDWKNSALRSVKFYTANTQGQPCRQNLTRMRVLAFRQQLARKATRRRALQISAYMQRMQPALACSHVCMVVFRHRAHFLLPACRPALYTVVSRKPAMPRRRRLAVRWPAMANMVSMLMVSLAMISTQGLLSFT